MSALLLSNSLGTDSRMWDDQVPVLEERFEVLRYDHRGRRTIADLGRDLLRLIDDCGLERVSLCGLSLGGMVGMWAAAEAPERIDRLVLACTAPRLPPRETWDDRIAAVRANGTESIVESSLERWTEPATRAERPDAVERLTEMLSETPDEDYIACCEAIRGMDLRDRLPRIEAPTLVIAGAHDEVAPPDTSQALADAIDGARLTVIPNARHLANIDQPDAFTRAVLEHLTGT